MHATVARDVELEPPERALTVSSTYEGAGERWFEVLARAGFRESHVFP